MPTGTYLHLDSGVHERFQCAPGARGWRYVANRTDGETIDLTVDSRWRPQRLELVAGESILRGGMTGQDALWVNAGREHSARVTGFIGDSPGLLVAVARSLRLQPGEHTDVRLVRLTGPVFAARTVPERWTLAETTSYDTDLAPLPVERFEVTDLETGEIRSVHLAGDVVIDSAGIELADLENPPNLS
jgi:hypothetical protein